MTSVLGELLRLLIADYFRFREVPALRPHDVGKRAAAALKHAYVLALQELEQAIAHRQARAVAGCWTPAGAEAERVLHQAWLDVVSVAKARTRQFDRAQVMLVDFAEELAALPEEAWCSLRPKFDVGDGLRALVRLPAVQDALESSWHRE